MADYAITNVARRIVYTGSAGVGPYAFSFPILVNTDIAVYKNTTLLTLTTDYTVTISGTTGQGSVTLVVAATGADRITIVGARSIERSTDFVTGGDFFANTLNTELDSETIFIQQIAETAERSIKAPVTDPTSIDMTLPANTTRANKFLSFNSTGNPQAVDSLGAYKGNWSASVDYVLQDIVKDTSNSNIYICISAHTSTGSQPISSNADVAKWSLVVDAAAAGTSATAAAASASAASTSATNAAASASTATTQASNASTSASTASTQASNASTSASNAASSASAASGSATTASTQASNASTSATNAASSASSASTSATNAANSATTATTQASNAATSASNASTSATSASGFATSASTQAGNAATSASNASTSATNAATSATNAATSATNAAASYDAFDDRYLGSKASAPSVDNDGNALLTGALYYNTTASQLYVWTGSAWDAAAFSVSGAVTSFSAGSTGFTPNTATTGAVTLGGTLAVANGGTGTSTAFTTGSVVFTGASGTYTQDNANFFWDDTNNRLGIGTTSPANTLHVEKSISSNDLVYLNNLGATAADVLRLNTAGVGSGTNILDVQSNAVSHLLVKGDGNVGIGTTSPYNATTDVLTVTRNQNNITQLLIDNQNAGASSQTRLALEASGGGWYIANQKTNNPLVFSNTTGERMRIDSSGNVGIGTSSPSFKVQVNTTVAATTTVQDVSYFVAESTGATTSGFGARLLLGTENANGNIWPAGIAALNSSAGSNLSELGFYTATAGPTLTERMRIDSSGNVGIGNTDPSNKLDVTGAKANADNDSLGQMIVRDTTAYNSTPIAGIQFALKYNTAGTYATGTSIQGFKENATDGNFSQALRFTTQANGEPPTERMRISSAGNVDIGTTANTSKVSIVQAANQLALNIGNENVIDNSYYGAVQITRANNPTGNTFHLAFVRNASKIAGMGFLDNSDTFAIQNTSSNAGNGVTLTSAATSWGTTSDERKKDIIGNVENAIEKLADWRSVYYKYKSDEEDKPQRVGLIAQDVQKTLPEAISVEKDDIQTLQLRYTETIPVLVKAIQEQQTIINDLKARIETLETK